MPSAVPSDATSLLPKARMIDPRGHRFGAGLSAIVLIGAVVADVPAVVALVLLSIGASAAFGLKYSIYGAIWRRLAKAFSLPKVEPEHEYPPRFAQVLGSVALILALVAFALGAATVGWGLRARGGRAPDTPGDDGLLPRLPVVLPALVGAGSRDADLDPWALRRPQPGARSATDHVPLIGLGLRWPGDGAAGPGTTRPVVRTGP